jgi:CMP-N,N'-diacetyllegionaminic acid synthase
MNLLFTICGRSGSKGLKNKNLLNLNEYPLVFYSLSLINLFIKKHRDDYNKIHIGLSTDSTELHQLCYQTNLDIHHIDRPTILSDDKTPKVLVIQHATKYLETVNNIKYDIIIDLDITSPIRRLKDLENIIKEYKTKQCDVVFSVTPSRRNPYFNMVKKHTDGFYVRVIDSYFTTRQEAPLIYDMNASIYAYRREFLLLTKNLFSGRCLITEMKDTGILDIDHQVDLSLLALISNYLRTNDHEWNKVILNIKKISRNF